jgi:threonine dehydratase
MTNTAVHIEEKQKMKLSYYRAGNSTLVEELKVQLPSKPSTIVLSVGGGGLLLGVMKGLERVGELMKSPLFQLIFSQTL